MTDTLNEKEIKEGKELMEKFLIGFKNKHLGKHEIQDLMDEVEIISLRLIQLKRKAGFFDRRGNIFDKDICPNCKGGTLYPEDWNWKCPKCKGTGKEDKEKIKQIVGDVV